MRAWAIAAELGMKRILIPKTAPGFSALGLLVADYRVDVVKAYVAPLSLVDVERLRDVMDEALDEARRDLLGPTGLAEDQVKLELFVQMAYRGQNFDISVPCPEGSGLRQEDLAGLADRFHDVHESSRGFGFRDQEPIVRGVRLIGQGFTPKPERAADLGSVVEAERARKGSRPAYFGDGFVDVPIYDGPRFAAGVEIGGPALIEEPFTVVVVGPGCTARLDERGNYDVEIAAS